MALTKNWQHHVYSLRSLQMCLPACKPEVPEELPPDPLGLPSFVPEDVILWNENAFNNANLIAHVISIDGTEYLFFIDTEQQNV